MCIVVCALCLPQNSSVYRHLCSTKGYFDPWTNGGMKISLFIFFFFLPVVIVEEAEKSCILNALLKHFILLFCIITWLLFPEVVGYSMEGCCIISLCISLFKSFYVSVNYLFSCHNHIWYGHLTTGFNKLCRGTTTINYSEWISCAECEWMFVYRTFVFTLDVHVWYTLSCFTLNSLRWRRNKLLSSL